MWNGSLRSAIRSRRSTGAAARLKEAFGDQVRFDGNVMHWQGELICGVFEGSLRSAKLGRGYDGRNLSFSHAIIKEHVSKHIGENEKNPRNMPLTLADFELIPSMWRKPDYIEAGGQKNSIALCLETFDGGILKMPVKARSNIPIPTRLFKQKTPGEHSQPVFHG